MFPLGNKLPDSLSAYLQRHIRYFNMALVLPDSCTKGHLTSVSVEQWNMLLVES